MPWTSKENDLFNREYWYNWLNSVEKNTYGPYAKLLLRCIQSESKTVSLINKSLWPYKGLFKTPKTIQEKKILMYITINTWTPRKHWQNYQSDERYEQSKTDKGLLFKSHKELMQINKIDHDPVEKQTTNRNTPVSH